MTTWMPGAKPSKAGELVWIYDAKRLGVTLGRWAGWWETYNRDDQLTVTHWRPIVYPAPPKTSTVEQSPLIEEVTEPHMIGYDGER